MANKITAYLGIGSNMDDRMTFLAKVENMLNKNPKITIIKVSRVYETEPWPKNAFIDNHPNEEEGQKWFLNQVIQIETALSPQELMVFTREIEHKMGRKRHGHWGDREIDIDVLLYGDQIIDAPECQIPHRHMQDRQFVLIPLVEIAPNLIDPTTGHKFSSILEKVREVDDHKVTSFL